MTEESTVQHETLFGHPVGLFTLFFAEMWERFSYYGMRALLVLYMTKGFLGYGDGAADAVYGAYTALVYTNGFIGGLFADRILGQRRSAILGGLLMAAGHLLMTQQDSTAFYFALGLLIAGNGFFKPNVTSMLGTFYPPGSPRRDGGYTIYYIGVNLGGAIAPLVCGYIGETYGWHNGFGLATIGMLVGLAVFVAPVRLTQILILLTAATTTVAMLFLQNNPYQLAVNIFAGVVLMAAGITAFIALGRGGLPAKAGEAPDPQLLSRRIGPVRIDVLAYLAGVLLVPVFALLLPHSNVVSYILLAFGVLSVGYVLIAAFRSSVIERHRLFVVLILTLFSMLFWAYFEQAGSSMNLFTDRNIDRVFEGRTITVQDIGKDIQFRIPLDTSDEELKKLPPLTQEQLGEENGDTKMGEQIAAAMRETDGNKILDEQLKPAVLNNYIKQVTSSNTLTITGLTALRDAQKIEAEKPKKEKDKPVQSHPAAVNNFQTITWKVTAQNVGMGVGGSEIVASMFQSANSLYILVFGLVFTALWSFLSARGLEPSTPVKFALGLAQVGLGFVVFWYGATYLANARGMVPMWCLLVGILLQTTGELSQSPIGLSMVTKLSPKYLLSTVMGTWFVGLGIANDLAARIAKLAAVSHGTHEGPQVVPVPSGTVHIYGHVFGQVAVAAFITALVCFALSPLLTKWMHIEVEQE
ncbi:MAG TPA: oligopeptide:H+ symporter [Lacipirellulaceae bacterium]|nr:oligopeptide:H+ symporter [Lacipirellulaceae bacterium]